MNWGYAWFWANPEDFTEGALTRAAVQPDASNAVDERSDDAAESSLPLFIDGNMDVFVGSLAAPPVQHVGNLRHDTPEQVYAKLAALELPPPPPPAADLAARYGDAQGRQVHMGPFSLRRKWLAAWRAEHRLPWLASY